MTNDQIAELAKQAGFSFEEEAHGRGEEPFTIERSSINELKRFAELVRNEALEEAAKNGGRHNRNQRNSGYFEMSRRARTQRDNTPHQQHSPATERGFSFLEAE